MKDLKDIIITDPTDQDVYKFSMQNMMFVQNLLHDKVAFEFFNRGKTKFPTGFGDALQYQINAFAELRFKDYMLDHMLRTMPWLSKEYIECYLRCFRYDPKTVTIKQTGSDLYIRTFGDWGDTTFWETQIMPAMSELLNFMCGYDEQTLVSQPDVLRERDMTKFLGFAMLAAKVSDFGLRRRYSKQRHIDMLTLFKEVAPQSLIGTSNLMLARELNLAPHGTIAHEVIMYMAAKYGPLMANRMTLEHWFNTYKGELGTILPDTYTTKVFMEDFDLMYAKLVDSIREDSAPDPLKYEDDWIDFYQKMKIDSATKTMIHSNGINSMELVESMLDYRKGELKKAFGIGTWLTNDVYIDGSGLKPVNWVIKMTEAYPMNRIKRYTVKLSDVPGKVTSTNFETVMDYKFQLGLNE
mgnify:CR=1 FL=1